MAEFLSIFTALTPFDYILCIFSTFAGIIVGAIPGLGATMAVAILTSFTAKMATLPSIAVLVGIYVGAVYGGSIAAILMKVPGTAAAIMTANDGYPLAQKGHAGQAIGISAYSSFIGGIIGSILLLLGCSAFSVIAVKFSFPEYFVLSIFGLCVIAATDENLLKGVISAAFGVLLAGTGTDYLTGTKRLLLGTTELMSGYDVIAVLIGIFGMCELMKQILRMKNLEPNKQELKHIFPTKEIRSRIHKTIAKSSLIGMFIGILPGAGAQISAFVAYETEKNSNPRSKEFGTGVWEGIAAPESANNATVGGTLVPALALGVPGDPTAAVIISALALHGVICGPMIFHDSAEAVNGIYVFMFIANIAMFIMAITMAKFFSKILEVDNRILVPLVLVVCVIGTFSSSNRSFCILIMVAMGVIGFLMEKVGLSPAAAILGVVLGQLCEKNLRSALVMSKGDWGVFFRLIPNIFWILTIIMVFQPRVKKFIKWRKMKKAAKAESGEQ
ncbi:MAG: C4-dicarboxylate ABC transporter permease [Hespellia sp.]|jgi:putative tricarboxylic transport membrane protein|nr:C4-dicarboxylate ABC transporter permease [Hespellia sp.]